MATVYCIDTVQEAEVSAEGSNTRVNLHDNRTTGKRPCTSEPSLQNICSPAATYAHHYSVRSCKTTPPTHPFTYRTQGYRQTETRAASHPSRLRYLKQPYGIILQYREEPRSPCSLCPGYRHHSRLLLVFVLAGIMSQSYLFRGRPWVGLT